MSVTFQKEKNNWEGGMMMKSGVAWQDTGEVMLGKSAGLRTPTPHEGCVCVCTCKCVCEKAFSKQGNQLTTWKGGTVLM